MKCVKENMKPRDNDDIAFKNQLTWIFEGEIFYTLMSIVKLSSSMMTSRKNQMRIINEWVNWSELNFDE